MTNQKLIEIIMSHRIRYSTESIMQSDVKTAIEAAGLEVQSEFPLNNADRIDFYLPEFRIGIECKTKGGFSSVASQLLRYANCEQIDSLILVFSRASLRRLKMPELNKKPFSLCFIANGFF